MADLQLAFQSFALWFGQLLNTLTSNWFSLILVFLFVLSGIVDILIVFRGGD